MHILIIAQYFKSESVGASICCRGINTGIHYPVPLHLQPAYAHLGYNAGSLPFTERLVAEILSLPLYPEMTPEQVNIVVAAIREFEMHV
jgi:dTDP-4-amino-4,6-dideoxygalactose transaminase